VRSSAEFSEVWCHETLRQARWPTGVTCPYCHRRRVTTHSKSPNTPRCRYLCLACRRTFSDTTGTLLARSNLPLSLWFACLRRSRYRQSTGELARTLGVKWDTAAQVQRRAALALARPGLFRQLREAAERMEPTSATPGAETRGGAHAPDARYAFHVWPLQPGDSGGQERVGHP